jgi:hypothetical protein
MSAWRRNWHSFVLVMHSFELVKRRRRAELSPLPDWVVIRRFEKLCRFLAHHADKFRTCGFSEINPSQLPQTPPTDPLKSRVYQTAERFLQQLARRML